MLEPNTCLEHIFFLTSAFLILETEKKVIGRQVNWIGYACFYVYVASYCSLIGWWLTSDILKKKLKSQLKLVFYVIWLVVLFIEQPSYIYL